MAYVSVTKAFMNDMISEIPADRYPRMDVIDRIANSERIRGLVKSARVHAGVYPVDAQPGDPGTPFEEDVLVIEQEFKNLLAIELGHELPGFPVFMSRTSDMSGAVRTVVFVPVSFVNIESEVPK